MIPKPAGGETPITLTPFVYFLWAALRRPLGAEWNEKAAGFWDDCIRGSNALRAGLARRLFDELAFEHNEANFSIYWDLTKFFDHVDLNRLALLAEQLGFLLKVLSLALNIHCNLRLLVHRGVTGCGISATRGILAGCPFSISFARACLYDILHAVHARAVRPLRLRQYVDDLAQSSTGPQRVAFEEAYETASSLFNRLVDAGFVISDKTTLVGSRTTYLEKLGVALRNRGIPVRTAKSVKDLGLDTTAGTRRCVTTQRKRVSKMKARAKRVHFLRRHSPNARKLVCINLMPVGTFGVPALGMPPSRVRSFRAGAARACHNGKLCCTTTAIALHLQQHKDPGVAIPIQVLSSWIELWVTHTDQRSRIRRIWPRLLWNLRDSNTRWMKVKGPIGATIAVLLDARWRSVHPDGWMLPEPCDDYWPIVTEGHQQGLIDHFAQTLASNLWNAASRFFEGAGVERGIDLSVPKSLLKRFQDEGRHSEYGLLSAVCVCDLWPAARKSAQGMLSVPTCPRCGKEPETLTHRHWQCEVNSLILEPEVVSTQYLYERAMSESETTPCFWNRGIVLMEWTVLPTLSETQPLFGHGDCSRFKETTVLYTDASVGNHTKDKRLRRVGWAVAAVSAGEVPDLLAAQCAPLPGAKQSVSRGELFAAVAALKLADPSKPLQIVTDCMYVVLGAAKTNACPNQRHAAIWHDFMRLKAGFTKGLSVRHVQSHIPAQLLWAGTIDTKDFVDNTLADAFAGRAASECQPF